MTRMPPFLAELSRSMGTPVESLEVTARRLREAGFVPPSKRGLGAEHVDARSAAALLLAAMTDAGPAGAVRTLEVYRGLKAKRRGGFGRGFPSLQAVADAPTFGEAISTLIAVAPKLRAEAVQFLMLAFDTVPPEQVLDLQAFELTITVSKPVPFARMQLTVVNAHGLHQTTWSCEWILDGERLMANGYSPEMQAARADRRTETTVTHKTIFKLSDLLIEASDEPDDEDNSFTSLETERAAYHA
jgi:hypothetical protein